MRGPPLSKKQQSHVQLTPVQGAAYPCTRSSSTASNLPLSKEQQPHEQPNPTEEQQQHEIQDRPEAIDWLLGLVIRLEYGDNTEKYKDLVSDNTKNADNAAKNAEPLINLDINNPDFKAGVMTLANLLQIQHHDDYLAIRILVQEHLTQDAVAKANQAKEGLPVALDKHILGFDTGDAVLNEAAQIL
ncbi:UPF0568 protein like protein [Myotis brandtii]|uniref:RNA transcription, translation and transport factor protein n=1 Tax=Myotis brandtii TaxID=109478 RepID=S7NK77_MYOBR|nr:UPF0568 protein like protein [Myotis brandtii]